MARPSETPAFWSIDCPFRRKFRAMKVSLERCFDLSLPLPVFKGTPEERHSLLKGFCSAPLERKTHLWDPYLMKRGKRTRFSVWMSLFLFRKVLPAKSPSLDLFMNKISEESPEPDPLFMEFVRKEVPKMFRPGWCRGYSRQVELSTVSSSACAELSRSKGGCRMFWLESFGEEARADFCRYLRGEDYPLPEVPAKISAVPTAGKVRILSVPSAAASLLGPLHKLMYNHISRFPWLLRGDAKAKAFKDFRRVPGEVFVSGDYESATDCLNQHVQKEILRLVLEGSSIPLAIQRRAMESLSARVYLPEADRHETVRTGQMMGFLLSFPLLCIVNFLAFKYAVMDREVPVLINGDDIVFRAKPEVASRWMKQVGTAGLKLSVGKTLVDNSVFTLNSTLFSATSCRVVQLPMIRAKTLFGTEDGYTSLPGRYKSFAPCFGSKRAFRLKSMFLRANIGYLSRSRRSLNRGLGIRVPEPILKTTRLWSREVDYLSLPREKPPPPTRSMWDQKPVGWSIAHSEKRKEYDKEEKKRLLEAIVSSAWCKPGSGRFEDVYDGGIERPALDLRKFSRLSGCGVSELKELMSKRRKEIFEAWLRSGVKLYPYWKEDSPPSADVPVTLLSLLTPADEGVNFDNENTVGSLWRKPISFVASVS